MRWHHAAITVSDMQKSLAFYQDILGFTLFMDEMVSGPELDKVYMETGVKIRMVMLTDETGNMIELVEWKSQRATKRPSKYLKFRSTGLVEICLSVPDLEKLKGNLRRKGIEFRVPIWNFQAGGFGTKVTYIEDPDGVQIELIQI
jgi:catechol 2,3-dioxygenase-like lactoylglutathione lyase family enzyme